MPANHNSLANQGGFHASVPSTSRGHHGEPLRRTLDREIGTAEHPVFHTKQFPPGTAPKEHTFMPNPISEIPGQALNPNMNSSLRTGPLDMPGSTTKSIYNKEDLMSGRPIEGIPKRMTSPAQTPQRKSSKRASEGGESKKGTGYNPASVEEITEENMIFKFSRGY